MIDEFKLAELLNAKFCHDLAGSIGAVRNSVDFLSSDNESMHVKAKNLIEDSSAESVYKLQFFRQLYGSIPQTGYADVAYFYEVTSNYFKGTKIDLEWDLSKEIYSQVNLSYRITKLLLALILCSSNILFKGGRINVDFQRDGDNLKFILTSVANDIKCDEETHDMLMGKINYDNLSSKNILLYYINRLISATNSKLKIGDLKTQFVFELSFQAS